MIDQIEKELRSGKTLFKTPRGFKVKVRIEASGLGGRYQAFIETPSFNTMVETSTTVDTEGPLTFYARLAPELVEIMRNVEFREINRRLTINSVYGKMGSYDPELANRITETGQKVLKSITGGIKPGELNVICAGSGVGKSIFGDQNVE